MTNKLASNAVGGSPIPASLEISPSFDSGARVVLYSGDCVNGLKLVPDGQISLVISSPPYNIGKAYEKTTDLESYVKLVDPVIDELVRVLSHEGSLCWQVGNYIHGGEITPLDYIYYPILRRHGLKLRNRIIWTYEHGLQNSKRFSGRYETLLWLTKSNDYTFNLDNVRVPSKYPGKRYAKGKRLGQPSGNPLGKNPSDVWRIVVQDWERQLWNIPNVKANHPEKTIHPCQFPIELVERCVLALTNPDDWVLDPYAGVASSLLAAIKQGRKAMGCDKEASYIEISKNRITDLCAGRLPYRPIDRPIYQPSAREKVAMQPEEWLDLRDECVAGGESLSVFDGSD